MKLLKEDKPGENRDLWMATDSILIILFMTTLIYFVCTYRKNINYYSKSSVIILCVGLAMRCLLLILDITLWLFFSKKR